MSVLSFLEGLDARARAADARKGEFVWLTAEEATRLLELGGEVHPGGPKGMTPQQLIAYVDHCLALHTKGVSKALR